MSKLKNSIIRFSKKLNTTNLSTLRSGNISVRATQNGVKGFYITPSGVKYETLKTGLISEREYDHIVNPFQMTKPS